MSDCIGGTIPSLQVINSDCSCISIQSITWNNAGNQFTITLNNGQSITSPVLIGAEGATPVIAFRVSGSILQYNVDGGAWISLYDLAQLTGSSVLENLLTNSATAGTAWETLKSYKIPAGQLSTDKDFVHIRAKFRSAGTIQGQGYRIQFNGSTLFTDTFTGTKAHSLVDIYINRNAQTTGRYDGQVFVGIDALSLSLIYASLVLPLTDIAGLDWDANPYTITCQGDSVVAGDVVCQELQVTYFHKS